MAISSTRRLMFLESLAKTGRILESCKAAGITHETIRVWRRDDEEFADAFADAELEYCEYIEKEIERRAIEGWEEPVFGRDEGKDKGTVEIGKKRKYSDTLLLALTRSRMAKYRDKVEAEITVKGQVLAIPIAALNEEMFDKLVGDKS